ncbi:MAG: PQQ-dependent sugar dehydrogenase [Acidimicrobiales bacterium]
MARCGTIVMAAAIALAACGSGSDEALPAQPRDTSVVPGTVDSGTARQATSSDEPDDDSQATTDSTGSGDERTSTSAPPPRPIPSTPLDRIELELELVAEVQGPVGMATRPGTTDLFVIEQRGRVRRLPGGTGPADSTPVLDLTGRVTLGNEQGLLGLAFSPDGEDLFVDYTDEGGDTVIARYDMDGDRVDPESGRIVMEIEQLRGNHNGGQLVFGPDGNLWIGLGDGGGGGDPGRHGQNPETLLGSVLRIDVTGEEPYSIPPDNPFVNGDGAPEVYLWGIRNAWRFGFDPVTDNLWLADVGQDRFEEVTVLRTTDGAAAGANLGWNAIEGLESFLGGEEPSGHAAPFVAYAHVGGRCSVTGGEVYRGSAIPALYGTYVFGDFCNGEVLGIRVDGSSDIVSLDISRVGELTSFGFDTEGELYAMGRPGGVFRIVAG